MEKIVVTTQCDLQSLIFNTVRQVLSEQAGVGKKNQDPILGVRDAAKFLQIAPQTLYGYTSKNLIGFFKKGKKLYFKESELEKWISDGRRKSINQINAEIDITLESNNRGR